MKRAIRRDIRFDASVDEPADFSSLQICSLSRWAQDHKLQVQPGLFLLHYRTDDGEQHRTLVWWEVK